MGKTKALFNISEKRLLLRMARETLEYYLNTGKRLDFDESVLPSDFLMPLGTFVSIHKGVALRGCIGQFECDKPVYRMIQEMAIAAADKDNRFSGIKYGELKQLIIEISVLGPLKKARSPKDIQLGVHGIYIKKGELSGTFLPQVAVQTGWTKDEFIGYCSRDKAGIGWDGWKDADLYIFTADVFNEKEFV